MIFLFLLLFLLAVIILTYSANSFVKVAKKISLSFRISSLIIGTTIVAVGTSLPEFTVTIFAVLKDDIGLALGNIVGSNIINILFVFAIGILVGKLRIGTTKTQRNNLILILVNIIFIVVILFFPSFFTGVTLIFCSLLFTIGEYYLGVKGREHEDASQFDHQKPQSLTFKDIFIIILSLSGIILGGLLTVRTVEELSKLLGYSTTVLGLSLTAIATSLPELLTTIFSQREHQEKISAGNIIGSNTYNLLLMGGIIIAFSPPSISSSIPVIDWIFFSLSAIIFALLIFYCKGKVMSKTITAILYPN